MRQRLAVAVVDNCRRKASLGWQKVPDRSVRAERRRVKIAYVDGHRPRGRRRFLRRSGDDLDFPYGQVGDDLDLDFDLRDAEEELLNGDGPAGRQGDIEVGVANQRQGVTTRQFP